MKNRISLAVFLWTLFLPLWAQIGGDFNPDDPSDPGTPVLKYTLNLIATPASGGSFSTSSTKVAVGERYNLRAYPNTDYVFIAWVYDGDTISKMASYDYTMPAHNVNITGVFAYDPSNPTDPQQQALKYQLSLVAQPINSGSFNFSNERIAVGSTTNIRAYANTDFVFKRWMIGDSVLSTEYNYDFIMPSHNVRLIGQFEYNPTNPANPNMNSWNKLTGEVIVDDFAPGYLSSAINTALNGSSTDEVLMITVAGKINDYDFDVANYFSNCSLLDLSRVTGVTEVPSYAFDYTNLESVCLPATIEKIGYRAFADCSQLSSLTIYAMTPPTLESDVFQGVLEELVVYVPAAAIAQYQEAEVWKNCTILPIQEDIRSVSISLPEGTNASDYAQMWLELTNTKSGQRMHYVMTDRQSYTFANIIRNTTWNVTLRNERGDVFGQIDNVEVKDEDVSVTFSSLSKPQSVVLSVLTPNGQDVTAQTQVIWTDAQGNYVAQGVSLTGLPTGYLTTYRVVLSQELAMTYNTPQPVNYVLTDGDNRITCQLNTIPQVEISGKVKDASTGLPISGAVISASQTFGGKYCKTLNARTDKNGVFTLDIANVPTSVAFAASDYVSQTLDFSNNELNELNKFTVPDVSLKTITGATITLGFTYTPCDGETRNWYNDYQNVSYELFNVTKKKAVSQYSVQYPQIVLLEEVPDGDVLRLTATSRTNAFMPVTATVTIAEQKAEATFAVVELGIIQASFISTGNASVVGSLYDAAGKLLKTYNYSEASLTISDLTDGNYTLVSMGSNRLFNTIYDLAQLPQTGLAEGTDYVQNSVEVKSGQVSKISISEVPTLDESKLYYTGGNTSFTVNKPSIVAGNYLTLTGRVDFKPDYAASVSNVQMIVDLPESCEFVENSVMVGNSISSYSLNNHKITIPMTRYTDRVRFCIIPTLGGEYAPSAFVQFDLNGETITQPIGFARLNVEDISITMPSIIPNKQFLVSGKATPKSTVSIYDGNEKIGFAKVQADGHWTVEAELYEANNLSRHHIYGIVSRPDSIIIRTQSKLLIYNKDCIVPKSVTMMNYAGAEYHTVFDFEHPDCPIPAFTYNPSYPDFTFLIDFSDNDTLKVKDVTLNVFTTDGKVTTIPANYDVKQRVFVAAGQFSSDRLPQNVSVSFNDESKYYFLREDLDKIYRQFEEIASLASKGSDLSYEDVITRNIITKKFSETNLSKEDLKKFRAVVLDDKSILYTFTDEIKTIFIDTKKDLYLEIESSYTNKKSSQTRRAIGRKEVISILRMYMNDLEKDIDTVQKWIKQIDVIYNTIENFINDYNIGIFHDGFSVVFDAVTFNIKVAENAKASIEGMGRYLKSVSVALGLFALPNEIRESQQIMREWIDLINSLNEIDCPKQQKKMDGLLSQAIIDALIIKKGLDHDLKSSLMAIVGTYASIFTGGITEVIGAAGSFSHTVIGGAIKILDIEEKGRIRNQIPTLKGDCIDDDSPDDPNNPNDPNDPNNPNQPSPLSPDDEGSPYNGGNPESNYDPSDPEASMPADPNYPDIPFAPNGGVGGIPVAPPADKNKDGGNGSPTNPVTPNVPAIIDPSGYVYEAVPSNRVQGATATAYYKETIEDMYGDLHENIVKWDAEEYAQENPLFTDENGFYRWDVPQGLWQVKFEKEGYETAYSEWLPVPPPQLDVNIAMKQNRQPEVKAARAFEDAVEVEFDKYMIPELLTTENIMVIQNGTAVEGIVKLLNEEVSYEGETETFASKIRFNATQPFTEQEITLMVNNRVKSYAGIRMQDNYQQTFTIGQEIKQIVSDSVVTVGYGNASTFVISVLPASASKGRKLTVKTSSPMILGVETEQVTIDNDGKAEITVSGELPGTAALMFSVEGTDKTAMTIANVEQIVIKTVATPTASIASGTVVEKGTAITLACQTEGATIYYTLDGSCPCDNTDARKVYDGTPVIINENVTIKAMAIAPGMYESEVAEFTYIVDGTGIDDITVNGQIQIHPLLVRDKVNITASGKMIKSVAISSINGVVVASAGEPATKVTLDVGRIPTGIYIINVTTVDSIFSRKILKVD